jgi:hypothetical protein
MFRSFVLILAGWACAAATAQTAATAPLGAEAFFRLPAVIDAELSPSGKRLAFTAAFGSLGRVGVFVLDLQSAELKPTRAAQFSDADVPDFYWVDDERIVFGAVDDPVHVALEVVEDPRCRIGPTGFVHRLGDSGTE